MQYNHPLHQFYYPTFLVGKIRFSLKWFGNREHLCAVNSLLWLAILNRCCTACLFPTILTSRWDHIAPVNLLDKFGSPSFSRTDFQGWRHCLARLDPPLGGARQYRSTSSLERGSFGNIAKIAYSIASGRICVAVRTVSEELQRLFMG